jgi:hypothetical protein
VISLLVFPQLSRSTSYCLPITGELLKSGARVCKDGSLLFLLLGPQNYQWCPSGVKRIGWISITVMSSNELRALHIFHKYTSKPDITFYGLRNKLDFCNIRNRSHGRREGDSEATMKSIASWQQQSATAWMDTYKRVCRLFAEII